MRRFLLLLSISAGAVEHGPNQGQNGVIGADLHVTRREAQRLLASNVFRLDEANEAARLIMTDMVAKNFENCETQGSDGHARYWDVHHKAKAAAQKAELSLGNLGANDPKLRANLHAVKAYMESLQGRCERNAGKLKDSINSLRKAVQLDPGNSQALSFIAFLILKLKGVSAAQQVTMRAMGAPTAGTLWSEFKGLLQAMPNRTPVVNQAIAAMS
jgi:hypothetical protein